MAASRLYGEFYDFYSISPEYFGYTLVCENSTAVNFFTNLLLHVPVFLYWELRVILYLGVWSLYPRGIDMIQGGLPPPPTWD
jgi:hypothetical protein